MKIIETTFERLPRERLVIGFEGENQRATVRIDCASVFAEYPNATPALTVRPMFASAFPVVVDRNGTCVDWLITSEILSFTGDGEIQLTFVKDQVICKSAIAKIRVCRSLQVTGEMPDPVAQWVDDANRKLAEVDAQIVELEGMVDTATDAATRAEQSESNATTAAANAATSAATASAKAAEAQASANTATAKAAESALSATQASNSAMSAANSESGATAKAAEAAQSAQTAAQKAEQITEAAQIATGKAEEASASATAAQASASNAASSATAASASETAAKASETAASTSATQAGTSAQNAGTAAQTATQKAGEAATSATNAAASATNAATSAETASTKAGEAAQSAQAVEETAEQLAESLEQISQNTADIAEHEQAYNALKAATLIHNTASGAIATFTDGAELPVDSVTAEINPVQDLHGYDHPWPAGGGKNLFDVESVNGLDFSVSGETFTNTVADTRANFMAAVIVYDDSGTVIATRSIIVYATGKFSMDITVPENSARILFKHNGATYDIRFDLPWTMAGTFTVSANAVSIDPTTVGGLVLKDFQIESGSTVTDYAPYSNICPITGHTDVTVTRMGANLFNSETAEASRRVSIANGNIYSTIKQHASDYISVKPEMTYTINFSYYSSGDFGMAFYGKDKTFVSGIKQSSTTSSSTTSFTFTVPADCYFLRFSNEDDIRAIDAITLVPGSVTGTDMAYTEPQTVIVDWTSEAGTVYGGELTVNEDGSGSLVVDRASVDMGELSWVFMNVNGTQRLCSVSLNPLPLTPKSDYYFPEIICSAYKVERVSQLPNEPYCVSMGFSGYGYGNRLIVNDETITTVGQATEKLSGQTCVYKLLAPIAYTLSASQIRTLLGTNNVWADAGDVSVKYNADTKLYIDRKIAELVAQIVNS